MQILIGPKLEAAILVGSDPNLSRDCSQDAGWGYNYLIAWTGVRGSALQDGTLPWQPAETSSPQATQTSA